MPIYLEHRDIRHELTGCRSALIVPCPICPAISLAVARREPYIDFFRRFLVTPAYARSIEALRGCLKAMSVPSTVGRVDFPIPLMCMWSGWQRQRLAGMAGPYDAVVVLGCDSAVATVRHAVDSRGCRVVGGMRVAGIVGVTPRFSWRGRITLETRSAKCVEWPES
jgi:hypothetical protein